MCLVSPQERSRRTPQARRHARVLAPDGGQVPPPSAGDQPVGQLAGIALEAEPPKISSSGRSSSIRAKKRCTPRRIAASSAYCSNWPSTSSWSGRAASVCPRRWRRWRSSREVGQIPGLGAGPRARLRQTEQRPAILADPGMHIGGDGQQRAQEGARRLRGSVESGSDDEVGELALLRPRTGVERIDDAGQI